MMFGLRDCVSLALLVTVRVACALPQQQQREDELMACGEAFYYADKVSVRVSRKSGRGTDGLSFSILATKVISCVRCSMVFRR
jgi:hypothetical protein